MKWFANLRPVLLATFVLSCASRQEPSAEPAKADAGPAIVGSVASVHEGPGFVLIRAYGKWEVPAGTVLTTRGGDGRTANLLATGESTQLFAAADIRSGTVAVGDAVLSLPAPKEEPAPPAAAGSPGEDGGARND